jgi:hypothetical protein
LKFAIGIPIGIENGEKISYKKNIPIGIPIGLENGYRNSYRK